MKGMGRKGWHWWDRNGTRTKVSPMVPEKGGNPHKTLEEAIEERTIEIRGDTMTPKTVTEIKLPVVGIKIAPGRE